MSQLVKVEDKALDLRRGMESARADINNALPKHMRENADRYFQIALEALRRPEIQKCSNVSIVNAVVKAAQFGLPLDNMHAAIVPYGQDATFVAMWQGLVSTVRRYGGVKKVWASVVFEGDRFVWKEGAHPDLVHEPSGERDMAKATHAYACALLPDGDVQFQVLTKADVQRVKARARGPAWKTDEIEQWKKTAVRNLCKYLEKTPEMSSLLTYDDEQERVPDYEVQESPPARVATPPAPPAGERPAVAVEVLPAEGAQEPAKSTQPPKPASASPRVTVCGLSVAQHDWDAVADMTVAAKHQLLKGQTYGELVAKAAEDPDTMTALQASVNEQRQVQERGGKVPTHAEFAAMALHRALDIIAPPPEEDAQGEPGENG